MSASQSNTRKSVFPINAGEDLTGMEGRLVKLVDGGSIPEVVLPTAIGDNCLYVVWDEATLDTICAVQPLDSDQTVRIRLNGTCSAGDVLVLEVISGANIGKVRTNPGGLVNVYSPGIAEEDGVDEQLVRVRPWPRLISGTGAFQGTGQLLGSGIHIWAGGADTTDSIPVVGLLTTDVAIVTLHTQTATEVVKTAQAASGQINVVTTNNAADTTTKLNWVAIRPA